MSIFKSYTRLATDTFGKIAEKNMNLFKALEPHLLSANIKVLFKDWVSLMFFTSFLAYVFSFISIAVYGILAGFGFLTIILLVVLVPIIVASFSFIMFYLYPIQKKNKLRKNIELNLPFALTHMAALSSSGLAPENMFEMMTGFEEYGEISKQAKIIVRDMKVFGMSSVKALGDIAKRTPSQEFRQILIGLQTTIEKGGSVTRYLKEMADESLNNYKIKRETYLKTLSTYADIYTAILVAAPLIFLTVLGIMGIIGGDVFGFSVEEIIFITTFAVLPALNLGFLGFIELTHPGI